MTSSSEESNFKYGTGTVQPGVRALLITRTGHTALVILSIEFLAAIQILAFATVTSEILRDLDGRNWYAIVVVITSATAIFATPIGGKMVKRYGSFNVLAISTGLYAFGTLISATAQGIVQYVLGRAILGFAAGALATVALGAIAIYLPASWQRLAYLLSSTMWVLPALLGPVYAVAVTNSLGWRWAIAIPLIPTVIVRLLAARVLREKTTQDRGEVNKLKIVPSACIALSLAAVTGSAYVGAAGWILGPIGAVVTVILTIRLLPGKRLSLARPGGQGLICVFLLTFAYFSLDRTIPVIVTEVLRYSLNEVAIVLTVGGVSWGAAGLIQATTRVKALSFGSAWTCSCVALILGIIVVAATIYIDPGTTKRLIATFAVGWAVASIGMGVLYPRAVELAMQGVPDERRPATAAAETNLSEITGASLGGVSLAAATQALATEGNVALIPPVIAATAGVGILVITFLPTLAKRAQRITR